MFDGTSLPQIRFHLSRIFGHPAGERVRRRSEPRHRRSTDTLKQARGRYRSDVPRPVMVPVKPDLLWMTVQMTNHTV
jgi:hypothetical protein